MFVALYIPGMQTAINILGSSFFSAVKLQSENNKILDLLYFPKLVLLEDL